MWALPNVSPYTARSLHWLVDSLCCSLFRIATTALLTQTSLDIAGYIQAAGSGMASHGGAAFMIILYAIIIRMIHWRFLEALCSISHSYTVQAPVQLGV